MNEKQVRRLVRERAISAWGDWLLGWVDVVSPMCEMCGKYGVEEMHHRLNRSQGGKWIASNIIGLCWWCHQWITEHPDAAAELGLHLRGGIHPSKAPVKLWYGLVILHDDGTWNKAPP